MNNSLLVIIPCAGIGNRFSSQIEKQHASLGDLSVIETTLDTFMTVSYTHLTLPTIAGV